MGEFSLELNDEQLQLQEWVHQFAEDVISAGGRGVG